MEWLTKRNAGLIGCLPLAVLVGYEAGLGHQHVPQHAGWLIAVALVVVGALIGLRAVLLVVAGCITWFVVAEKHSQCVYECGGGVLILAYALVQLSVLVALGAATTHLWKRFVRPS